MELEEELRVVGNNLKSLEVGIIILLCLVLQFSNMQHIISKNNYFSVQDGINVSLYST